MTRRRGEFVGCSFRSLVIWGRCERVEKSVVFSRMITIKENTQGKMNTEGIT